MIPLKEGHDEDPDFGMIPSVITRLLRLSINRCAYSLTVQSELVDLCVSLRSVSHCTPVTVESCHTQVHVSPDTHVKVQITVV